MINADRCTLLQPVPEREQHLAIGTNDPAAVLRLFVGRLEQLGIETFGLPPRFCGSGGAGDRARPSA
jgi:hypothetical protein